VLDQQPQKLVRRRTGVLALVHGLLEAAPTLGDGSILEVESLAHLAEVDLRCLISMMLTWLVSHSMLPLPSERFMKTRARVKSYARFIHSSYEELARRWCLEAQGENAGVTYSRRASSREDQVQVLHVLFVCRHLVGCLVLS
jgi:hypothetical protein